MAQADVVYIDANLSATGNGISNVFTAVNRGSAIIERASDYFVSVNRFVAPAFACHMWQPVLMIGQVQNPPLQTIYNCVLSYNGTDSAITYMQLVQTVLTSQVPKVPLQSQPTNDFATVWDYSTICLMINNTFAAAFASLKTKLGGTFPGLATQPTAPYITFNPQTSIFSINAYPFIAYDSTQTTPTVKIYWGAEMAPFLAGWNVQIISNNPTGTGKDQLMLMANLGNNWLDGSAGVWSSPPGLPASPNTPRDLQTAILQMSQGWAATWCWQTAMSSIQIVTNLPTLAEQTSPPQNIVNSGINSSQAILADFSPDLSLSPSAFQQPMVYNNTASNVARFVQLTSQCSITTFSVEVYWIDSFGVQRPLQLNGLNQSCSIKLCFTHKSLVR